MQNGDRQKGRDEMKQKYVYVVVALGESYPRILGVYTNKKTAESVAGKSQYWCNVIKKELNAEN